METPCGVDADGFIMMMPEVPIQPEFIALIDDVCATLSTQAGDLLDGIYLYGSIANGTARPGLSDLDLSLVLRTPPAQADQDKLASVRLALARRHPEVVKIDFDIGNRAEVLAPEHLFSWGYWLKHHCRCLWGNDLSTQFDRFKPSRAIALAVNGDFDAALKCYAERMKKASEPAELRRLQREASRKLIRSTNVLRTDEDNSWPRELGEYAAQLLMHYPQLKEQVDFFLTQAKSPDASADEFIQRLQNFSEWMTQEAPSICNRNAFSR